MDLFSGLFFIFIFDAFLQISETTSEWTKTDGRNEGIRCFEQIIHDGDISNLLIDVTTPERIDDFCRRHSELQRCTRENEHFMSVEENTEYLKKTSGVHNFYVNICPPGTDITADYKGNSPCFKYIRNEILSCGSDLPDLSSYKMKNNLRSRCCALKKHRECLKKIALEHCGYEAASVIERIHLRYFDSKMKECNATSYRCDENSSTAEGKRTTVSRWNSQSEWQFPDTTREHDQRGTEKDWKSTTAADWKSFHHDEWKKHKHHNGAFTVVFNSGISILSCFVSILLLKM